MMNLQTPSLEDDTGLVVNTESFPRNLLNQIKWNTNDVNCLQKNSVITCGMDANVMSSKGPKCMKF